MRIEPERELGGARAGPPGDSEPADAAVQQVQRDELPHRARADDERAQSGEVAELTLHELDGDRRHRDRMACDLRLGAHPPPGLDRLLEEAVQRSSRRAGIERERVSGTHLAEDLALARDERVQPGRDAEEMARRVVVAITVERPIGLAEDCQRTLLDSRPVQHIAQPLERAACGLLAVGDEVSVRCESGNARDRVEDIGFLLHDRAADPRCRAQRHVRGEVVDRTGTHGRRMEVGTPGHDAHT